MTSKPALPVKPCTIRIMDTNGDDVLQQGLNYIEFVQALYSQPLNNISDQDPKFNMDNIGKQFGNHLTIGTEPLSRSRASSMNEDGDQKFEEELFNKCKQNEGDQKATSGVLLHVGFSVKICNVTLYLLK